MGRFSNKLGKRHPQPRGVEAVDADVRHAIGSLLRRADGRLALRVVELVGERLDLAAQLAPDAQDWACAAGCNFCCHMPVIATAPELVRLANAVLAHPDVEPLLDRIHANADAIAEFDESQLFESRMPCALLDLDGRCSVYAARPLACRGHVSFSRELCEAAHVGDLVHTEATFDGDPDMQQARTDADTRLATSLITAGLDGMGYELHDGLARALALEPERWSEPEAFAACKTVQDRVMFDAELREAIAEFTDS